jgi:hypothetical protein
VPLRVFLAGAHVDEHGAADGEPALQLGATDGLELEVDVDAYASTGADGKGFPPSEYTPAEREGASPVISRDAAIRDREYGGSSASTRTPR